jgi:hypothetical protein
MTTDHIAHARPALPPTVDAFVRAINAFDAQAATAAFADDALVNDFAREFWGKDAIAAFIAKEFVGDRVTMDVTFVDERHRNVTVEAILDGNYPKDGLPNPLVLTFYFALDAAMIAQLIVVRNKTVATTGRSVP